MFLSFLEGIDRDLRESFLASLRSLWTHHSTALEGNTLTLGETHLVLGEGLTISGKPLSEHNEVVGHARAIDLIFELCRDDRAVDENDLHQLHKAVQNVDRLDVFAPVGIWKKEENSTSVVIDEQIVYNDTYALPRDTPALMTVWLQRCNQFLEEAKQKAGRTPQDVLEAYVELHASFVRIHPYADGNGRMARLLANLPVLRSGLPPLVISTANRGEYIESLARWQMEMGRPSPGEVLFSSGTRPDSFAKFCFGQWESTRKLVNEIREKQAARDCGTRN
ncbi:MAG: Fic family protein [Verrucomicrobiales bacterium]|nr:Fic family protein [Verrucomicrobiales bacterium]